MVAIFKGMGFQGVHIGGFALKLPDFRFIVDRAAQLESRWEEFVPEICFSRKDEYYAFPPPKSYRPGETADPDPLAGLGKIGTPFMYSFALFMHHILFERQSLGHQMMAGWFRAVGDRSLPARFTHFNESISKQILFGCRDCGDCGLADMAYCCPQGGCAKQQRNGPCGGSVNGMCEVYPDEKPCVWTLVYKRLKSVGRLNEIRAKYVPPRMHELEHTSGWANYFLNRDHAAVPAAAKPESPPG
jgi:methylenetetrahydrofolate reductase (NADPH)